MLTFGRMMRSTLIAGALGVFPLSTALADEGFGSTTDSCTGGSLNICLDFNLAQLGNPRSQHYSLDLILNAIDGGALPSTRFSTFGSFKEGGAGSVWDFAACSGGNQNGNCDNEDEDQGNGFSGTGGPSGTPRVSLNAADPTTTTPEPASLFLVGTGLAGLGGFGITCRRRG
jgi:hypothetical protein